MVLKPIVGAGRFMRWVQGAASNQLRKAARTFSLLGSPAACLDDAYRSSFEMLDLIPRDQVQSIWDVGAAHGSWAVLAASMFPKASVHAFEPQSGQVEKMRSHLFNLPSVEVHSVALGDEASFATLHVTNNLDSSSLLTPLDSLESVYGITEASAMNVEVCTGADMIRHGVPVPDVLKLDVQGHELAVINGLGSYLSEVKYLIIELAPLPFYDGQPSAAKVLHNLEEQGFQIYALGANTLVGQRIFEFDVLLKNISVK